MTEDPFYTIGKVAQMLNVTPAALRYWETDFPSLRPRRNESGTRYYTKEDVERIKYVIHLKRDCGYSIEGVRERLHNYDTDSRKELIDTLTHLRTFLTELKEKL